jgi:hypothetical protein
MRQGAVVAAGFAAVMLLTGCSLLSSDESDRGTASPDGGLEKLLLPLTDYTSSTMWLLEQRAERKPAKKLYGVFRRPRTKREIGIVPPCSMPGLRDQRMKLIPGLTRVLLRGIGRNQDTLVAQPMTSGRVALGLTPDGSANCGAAPMTADGLILAAQMEDGDAVLYGMVGDGVESLDVVIDGVAHHARLEENGFATNINDAQGKVVEKLVLTREDGSTAEFPPD